MIQAILLIALGFLTASLIGVLIAPSLWNRAYRLSRRRLEQSLPVSLSEIEAAQDQLKASYAVRMRRLETALASAKQKAAMQLVDNSRLQMQIAALKDQITDLDLKLSERRNAATVLEQTITKRFPELDREITAVKQQLQERSYELQDLRNKLARRSEELEAAGNAAASYESELTRLREAMEKNSADRSGRRLRRASQWSLDDYRAEYDRLNLELSKLRQQLAQLQDKDAQQAGIIKEELQKLAELILVSAQPKGAARVQDRPEPAARRAAYVEARRDRPVPWPESIPEKNVPFSSSLLKAEPHAPDEPPAGTAGTESEAFPGSLSDAPADKNQEPADASHSAHPRSMLLREAVPDKPVRQAQNGPVAEDYSTGGQASGDPAPGANDSPPLQAEDGLGDGPGHDLHTGGDLASQGRSLLDRLRGATEQAAEAEK
jgi:hypothetical protein